METITVQILNIYSLPAARNEFRKSSNASGEVLCIVRSTSWNSVILAAIGRVIRTLNGNPLCLLFSLRIAVTTSIFDSDGSGSNPAIASCCLMPLYIVSTSYSVTPSRPGIFNAIWRPKKPAPSGGTNGNADRSARRAYRTAESCTVPRCHPAGDADPENLPEARPVAG